MVEELVDLVFEELDVGLGGGGGVGFFCAWDGLEEVLGADSEGFGDTDDGAEGGGGVSALDAAPVADVDAGELGGLGLVEGWVVFLAQAGEEGSEVGARLEISFRHIVNLSVSRRTVEGC